MPLNEAAPVIAELGFAVLAVLVFRAAAKRFGLWPTTIFFLGSILWTGPLENFAVLRGAYTYYGYADLAVAHYPGYLMWIGVLPFWIILGWFVFAMSGYVIFHEVLLSKKRALVQAAASGLFAVNIDLMMDPVASSNSLWIWLTGAFKIFGVPIFNFAGWFLLIFFYDLIAWHTIMNNRPMPGLSRVESRVFGASNAREGKIDYKRLVFRIVALETVVIIFLTLLTSFIDYIAYSVL